MESPVSLAHCNTEIARMDSPAVGVTPVDYADILVAYLEQLGVDYVFGVPGGAIEPLYNALAKSARRGGIRHMLARHETGAAFMADGYARETGKIGVCCSTSGPGATNLITGVACAYDNNVPLLVITGQPALPAFGKYALQESSCTGINVLEMFRSCTRYNSLISHPDQLELKLATALQRVTRAPFGPAHLSIPVDVFRSSARQSSPSYDLRELLKPAGLVDEDAVQLLLGMIKEARKVVMLIGAGCGEAIGVIMQFAMLADVPFVTTPDGKGLVNPRHSLFRGVFGFGGHTCAEAALRADSVDLIFAIGTSLGEWNSGGWSSSVLNERLVHIDECEENLARTPMARMHIRGRIVSTFNRLIEIIGTDTDSVKNQYLNVDTQDCANDATDNHVEPEHMLLERDKYHSDAVPIVPQRLMGELGRLFPTATRFLADTGNSVSWAIHYLHPSDRRFGERRVAGHGRKPVAGRRQTDSGWLRVTMNFAPMGWAIGGAIGTAAANPEVPVVCITGDGSMLMNGQEISVAVAEKLTVIFVVLNDQVLGMVNHGQRLAGAEQIGCSLPETDFAALARALGAHAHTIRSPKDMAALDIDEICRRKGPTLLDVRIDANEVPPMSVRMRVLSQ